MKRYKMINEYDGTENGITKEEDPDGKWVNWEDHEKEAVRFTEMYENWTRNLVNEIRQLRRGKS